MIKKLLIVLMIVFLNLLYIKSTSQSIYSKLNDVAVKLNNSMPQMLDKYTRIDSLKAIAPDTLTYYGTIFHIKKDKKSIQTVKNIMESKLLDSVKTGSNFKPYRDNKVKIVYSYYDESKKLVFGIFITPEKYFNRK